MAIEPEGASIASKLEWRVQRFEEFKPIDLYALLAARVAVFVVEQTCPYQELDDRDADALHLSGWKHGTLLAYARLVPPGGRFETPSVGRVLTTATARGRGIGSDLMRRAIDECERLWPDTAIRVSAQQHLQAWYESLGFVPESEIYDEDGIPHIDMLRPFP